ncbi:hypothetical protein SAMN05421736_10535 [Evansella caseinilytica]|uniref:Uncharacterized protein n=1 Tax=Evansella caseinilytica TaxID=1503961 RepID=A0A1H3PFU3_9BACI|nr:hypothetical protein [Evansella caseinilytica]SDY99947.1 hypothetical protein SAMN05421736_10535 [Evansella caseinilytica]
MGYIPPVRDEQVLLYHHRQKQSEMNISPSPRVQRVEFSKSLERRSHRNRLAEEKAKAIFLSEIGINIENDLTGKGTFVDEKI